MPPEKAAALSETRRIVHAYLMGVWIVSASSARDPDFAKTHLLRYLVQDLIEAAVSVEILVFEGVHRVIKRELRFIIEASAKLASVQQANFGSTIEEKLADFDEQLKSHRISVDKSVNLHFLDEATRRSFVDEVGRIYGGTSAYVHWTPNQIRERVTSLEDGRVAGQDTVEEINSLNDLLSRSLAASLVLLLHGAPTWVAGDWLVEQDGTTVDWYFTRSRFIAAIDASFDYKAERKDALAEVQQKRLSRIKF